MEPQLHYATKRIVELESLLLVEVTESVGPAEGIMVFVKIGSAASSIIFTVVAEHTLALKK